MIEVGDAEELCEALTVNRMFLAPSSPVHPDEYFTVDAQRTLIVGLLHAYEGGHVVPHVIVSDERIIGQIFLSRSFAMFCNPRPSGTG